MLETKFFRDYKHSYMILRCEHEQTDTSYQCRLLTSGQIGEILRCSIRHVNGESFFYYDISSRTTLESLYRSRRMSFAQVRELFEQLYNIYCRLGNHFMEEVKLVLLPQYIFYDLSRKKYIGLYYPDYEEEKPYEALMDYLLEHIDSQDVHLADCVYQMYERAEESGFSLEDAMQLLEDAGEEKQTSEDPSVSLQADVFREKEIPLPDFSQEDSFAQEPKGKEAHRKPQKKSLRYPFLAALSVLGIAGIACVYGFYELSEQEVMTLLVCGGLMVVCFLVGLTGMLKNGIRKGDPQKETDFFPEEQENTYFSAVSDISLENVLHTERKIEMPAPAGRSEDRGWDLQEPREEYGNTVFFDSARTAEYKLYALDKKNKRHIELTHFPYTVGKMAGCVDCVLADDSVSRIHARFEKVGDTIQLTDMNSTNGTYRNGLRMEPQETVEIEPGDEIRFGNLNYCYR